jgi:hypothetical protein
MRLCPFCLNDGRVPREVASYSVGWDRHREQMALQKDSLPCSKTFAEKVMVMQPYFVMPTTTPFAADSMLSVVLQCPG